MKYNYFNIKYAKNIIDNIILYIPKTTKLCSFIYFISFLITIRENMNESTMPNIIKKTWNEVIGVPFTMAFTTFKDVAPSIVGIAKKNENSVAAVLDNPNIMAPIIVAADLEVPGTIAKHWATPIIEAVK